MSQAGGEKELVLGNKQLISLFFVVVALCGVFFAMGYMVRGNSLKGTISTATDGASAAAASSDTAKRQQPEAPLPTDSAASPEASPAPAESAAAPSPTPETRPAQDTPTQPAPVATASRPDDRPVASIESGASYVQVGALARADAESTARTLREQHLPAVVAASSKEGLFRVLVGPYHLTTDVADAKAKLKTLGFSNTIVQKQ